MTNGLIIAGDAAGLSVLPIPGLPHFAEGDDIATAIAVAMDLSGIAAQAGDIFVIAQKIVSKAEGRTRDPAAMEVRPEALKTAAASNKNPGVIELVYRESQRIMRAVGGVVIVRHRTGHVLANAGIDASNVGGSVDCRDVLLWPENPDASALEIRDRLVDRLGIRVAVIISDSLGRAWRVGTIGTAIGCAGLKPLRDRRGEFDLFGRKLEATVVGIADEVAAAASLVMGEAAEGLPVAIVRGARYEPAEQGSITDLIRPVEQDLFP